MGDLDMVMVALGQVFSFTNMAVILGGLLLGIIVGCIPGLSVTLGIILLLPLTYTFSSPDTAIISLLSVYVGGMYGGSISAILLNSPGTNSAIVTTFDGYPLAQQGKVKKVLDTSLFASVFGGIFSALILLLFSSLITKLVASFASTEYFALAILGISLLAGVSGDNLAKGVISGLLGIFIACIGADAVTGVRRFTFDTDTLKFGIDMVPAMIAFIALTQVVLKMRDYMVSDGNLEEISKIDHKGLTMKEAKSIVPACFRSSTIASIIGAMPGVGGGVAQFLCYNEVRRASKRPQDFGKGSLEGVAAAEASNNAVVGSAMIPLLTLGIPGDGVTALLLGAFILHGIQPGPTMFTKQGEIAYSIILGTLVANILLIFVGAICTRAVAKIVQVKYTYLAPVIILFCFAGAFAATGNTKELIITAALLVISYLFVLLDFSVIPLMLGMILADIMEMNFVTSMMSYDNDIFIFFKKPITLGILILTVILLVSLIRLNKRVSKLSDEQMDEMDEIHSHHPEISEDAAPSNVPEKTPASESDVSQPVIITLLNKKDERIEIKNVTNKPIDLSGWYILSVTGGQKYTFSETIIQPDATISIGDQGRNPDITLHWLVGRGVWNDKESDPAELYNANGELVDRYND